MKVGDRVEMIPGNIFEHQSNVPGTVINIDEGDLYPIVVKWDNGKEYCYTEKHIRLIAKFRVGDEVMIAPTSMYFGQFDGLGTITEVDHIVPEEGHHYAYTVEADSGYSNGYRHEDLILADKDKIHVMADIASDPVLVSLLRKWYKGPISECPYNYGSVKKDCFKLCHALFPTTGPGCPCNEPTRKETVEIILKMADITGIKPETAYKTGSVFADDEGETFMLAIIEPGVARLIAVDGSGYWGDKLNVGTDHIVHFPEDFLEGLTFQCTV